MIVITSVAFCGGLSGNFKRKVYLVDAGAKRAWSGCLAGDRPMG
jgi:hypothetical protein